MPAAAPIRRNVGFLRMGNSWLSNKSSIQRVSFGVRRFLANVAGDMRDRVEAMVDTAIEPSDELDEADLPVVEPEAIRAEVKRELDARELEQQQIGEWRAGLDKLLRDRAEHRGYFEDLQKECLNRYEQRLAAAGHALRRPDDNDTEGDEDEDLVAARDRVVAMKATAATRASEVSSAEVNADTDELDKDPFDPREYRLPALELLDAPDLSHAVFVEDEEIERQKRILQDTLDSFAVDAHVYDAIVGPRITQFRVQPGTGVRVESIASLERNICLALASTHIRIQAPIPGEPFVGIEVGNTNAFPVQLRAMLDSRTWEENESDIPLVLGMDIQGKILLTDLAKAPHLLIAGATGSGKSVCMSNLVLSLLYRFRPDELELVMIDPKRVEFGMFQEVPHLIHPVVTEPKMAVLVLKWVVKEMQRRYEVLATRRVRNIAGYNAIADREGFARMPFMVVIIDELADLMMTSKGEAEEALARIAQLSRAVGIHTIIATQRPSVNVITGVIKANYPTRIAFQVSSQIDSRTILDCKGAESLLGRGDMLFNPPGIARLIRIQSPMVEDHEISQVVGALGGHGRNSERVDLASVAPAAADGPDGAPEFEGDEDEALLRKSMLIIAQTQKASTSYLQRRLRIGYNRAATLMEELEDRGYVSPQIGSTPREVFISPEDCGGAQ